MARTCPSTGEVGLIVIRGTERFRGGTRVTFLAGRRALESYRALRDTADAAARDVVGGRRLTSRMRSCGCART